jgi:hypothetical protein
VRNSDTTNLYDSKCMMYNLLLYLIIKPILHVLLGNREIEFSFFDATLVIIRYLAIQVAYRGALSEVTFLNACR